MSDIEFLPSEAEILLRTQKRNIEPCVLCGRYHVLNYGGDVYCRSPHHFGHLPTGPLSPGERELAAQFEDSPGFKSLEEAREWVKKRKEHENV